jgi:hypothetical protein
MTTAPPAAWAEQAEAGAAAAWAERRQRKAWRRDPVAWAQARGIELWSEQRRVLMAAAEHDRVAVRSAHDTGKSFSMAVLVAWFLDTHPIGETRVITTAPTGDQVRGILWNEINALWEKHEGLPGRINQTEIWIGSYQAAVGRKSSDYRPAAFSGFHARHILIIVDEADGIPASLWSAIDTLATNAGAIIVAIGNPDDPTSEFRKRQSDQPFGGTYYTIKIPAWSTPNFSGEDVSQLLHDVLLSPRWVEEKRIAWGGAPGVDPDDPRWAPDHPFWSSKVEAEYPDEAANAVVRVADLLRARRVERDDSIASKRADRHGVTVGIDVAGSEGGDESVVRGRQGNRLLDQVTIRTGDPEELEDWLVDQVTLTFAATRAQIDADGIGFGYAGALRRRCGRKTAVAAIRSAASANDPATYLNRRAEMWWHLAELLRKSGDDQLDFSALDDETAAQLLAVRRVPNARGKIQIESKDDLRRRIGRSPDGADSLVYAYAEEKGSGVATLSRPTGSLGRR